MSRRLGTDATKSTMYSKVSKNNDPEINSDGSLRSSVVGSSSFDEGSISSDDMTQPKKVKNKKKVKENRIVLYNNHTNPTTVLPERIRPKCKYSVGAIELPTGYLGPDICREVRIIFPHDVQFADREAARRPGHGVNVDNLLANLPYATNSEVLNIASAAYRINENNEKGSPTLNEMSLLLDKVTERVRSTQKGLIKVFGDLTEVSNQDSKNFSKLNCKLRHLMETFSDFSTLIGLMDQNMAMIRKQVNSIDAVVEAVNKRYSMAKTKATETMDEQAIQWE